MKSSIKYEQVTKHPDDKFYVVHLKDKTDSFFFNTHKDANKFKKIIEVLSKEAFYSLLKLVESPWDI